MADFSIDDLNVLLEALEAWKDKDSSSDLIDLIIPMISARTKEEAQAALADRTKFATRQARAAAKATRVERAIILQAKILEMRRQIEAQAQ